MPDLNLDFNFYAGGIEDGILEALKVPMKAVGGKSFLTYSGELDDEKNLKEAIAAMAPQFPLTMVSYSGGENIPDPPTSPVLGRPIHLRHDCSFGIIVADNNPQGETQRRRGKVFEMVSVVWDTLTNVRLKKQVDEDNLILLNTEGFLPVANIRVTLPGVTAWGVILDTAFKWSSPDRTTEGTEVDEIIVGVNSENDLIVPEGGLPGVSFEIGEN